MNFRITMLAIGVTALLAAGLVAAGCGSSDDETATESETVIEQPADSAGASTAAQSGGQTLGITMGDYDYTPVDATASAGSVTIEAPNDGQLPHELVLAKTNLDPAKLPTLGDGTVDEESLDSPGEVGETAAGETGTATLDLEPGKYAMFCNLPGHYAAGMYGTLTVK